MKKNVGSVDKVIRYLIAIVLVVLYFTHVVTGTLGVVLLVVAGVMVVTSLLNFCPIWAMLGVSTAKKKE